MKKILYLLVLILVFSDSAVRADIYINGINKNNPPFAFIDEKTGKAAGFDVDSMTWIAKEIGFEIEHRPMDWDGIVLELITDEIDMICSGMNVDDESKILINFSEPYWEKYNVLIIDRRSEMTIDTILSTQIKLGVRSGTEEALAIAEEKKSKKYPMEIRYYADTSSMFKALLFGNISAVLMNNFSAKDVLSKGNDFKIIGVHGVVEKFGVAVRKDDNALKNMVNDGYKLLKANSYWKELQDKYFKK